ncbi:MAG: 30S ribosomal protein S7, partial [Patescibacteria group bacterium]
MPRRKYKIRPVKPDLIHNSRIVSKLINIIMHDGKKSVAEGIVYSAMEIMKKQNINPQEVM